MEYIAKILDSLKENEKSILLSIIANALIIYLICFLGIKEFKTYQWYQQLIIPSSISICYISSFYIAVSSVMGLLSIFVKLARNFFYDFIESNLIWYSSILCICNCFTLIEITNTLIDKSHCFSFSYFLNGIAWYVVCLCFFLILGARSIYISNKKLKVKG